MTEGIDVSRWQGADFDFARAKRDHGITYAILRVGGADDGMYRDLCVDDYYVRAHDAGLDVGFYFFGNARTVDQARAEADFALSIIGERKFEYPMYYDVESSAMMRLSKRKLTDVVIAFLDRIESRGFWAGVYASTSVFENKLYDDELVRYSHWVADWRGAKPDLSSGAEVQMWQTGSAKNYQDGKEVDNDICYVDYYADAVRRNGLNNYGTRRKSNDQIAREVWAGLWGNGDYRRKILTAKGYDYNAIQSIVRKMKKEGKV